MQLTAAHTPPRVRVHHRARRDTAVLPLPHPAPRDFQGRPSRTPTSCSAPRPTGTGPVGDGPDFALAPDLPCHRPGCGCHLVDAPGITPLVLTHRIHPMVVADAIRTHRLRVRDRRDHRLHRAGRRVRSHARGPELRVCAFRAVPGSTPIPPDRLEAVLPATSTTHWPDRMSPSHIVPLACGHSVDAIRGDLVELGAQHYGSCRRRQR